MVVQVLNGDAGGLGDTVEDFLGGVGGWGAMQARSYVPDTIPGVWTNRLAADNFWETAARSGVESVVLDAALAFGRPDIDGMKVLAGLGVPDLRGNENGEWFIYTDDEFVMDRPPEGDRTSSTAGTRFRIDERDGQYSTDIYGPPNFFEDQKIEARIAAIDARIDSGETGWKETGALREEKEELEDQLGARATVPMVIKKQDGAARVTIGSQSQVVQEGEWSDWYRLSFDMNPLLKASAVTRVKVMSLEEPFELFVNNLEIDPANPVFWQPISMPNDFAAELVEWVGEPFETTGWSCMTNQLKDKVLDVQTFLQDIEYTMAWREKLTYAALERRADWRLLFSVFSTTDRVQHMMYKYYDPEHPLHDAEEAARMVSFFGETIPLSETIPTVYRQMDRIVGEVRQRFLDDDDVLMLCADHGFTSYRRGININNWLAEEGYLVLKEGVSRRDGSVLDFYIDWERTRAYSLGLGMVFLNLEGREPQGIVKREEADGLMAEISQRFLEYQDPETGLKVGQDATIMKDLYPGDWGSADYVCADIMFGFAENYRVEWNNVLGRITLATENGETVLGPIVKDNSNNWSGDHASNSPHLVTGIFFSSQPVEVPEDGVSVMHIAPTVLERLGVERPEVLLPALARR